MVTRDDAFSSQSTMKVGWTAPESEYLPILGYNLEMDDGFSGPFSLVYSGVENAQQLDFVVSNLVAPRFYRFRVYAIDVNGAGAYSEESSIQACIPPSELGRPLVSDIGKTSFTLSWSAPLLFGGCPVTSYELWRDQGDGGEVNVLIDAESFPSRPN